MPEMIVPVLSQKTVDSETFGLPAAQFMATCEFSLTLRQVWDFPDSPFRTVGLNPAVPEVSLAGKWTLVRVLSVRVIEFLFHAGTVRFIADP